MQHRGALRGIESEHRGFRQSRPLYRGSLRLACTMGSCLHCR
ncbi:hypothetical protein PXO_03621 [Xanthomonas oryzae pv. oryzae PXO99A]|uniref:Uncharacterized protein n=1 Tax=Xanthomonas oryzae pv. oryzae (strain PXO99A) TaxID=360094 RepID=A0A0K0GFF3_XANOP|nr:hypothetical protein PXO_03621 [Xanthomonas oryzae pv. oryzae PXO99A]